MLRPARESQTSPVSLGGSWPAGRVPSFFVQLLPEDIVSRPKRLHTWHRLCRQMCLQSILAYTTTRLTHLHELYTYCMRGVTSSISAHLAIRSRPDLLHMLALPVQLGLVAQVPGMMTEDCGAQNNLNLFSQNGSSRAEVVTDTDSRCTA